jgi:ferredoxin
MPYVVTENCTDCRFTDCVSVCPVECFHGDDKMLYIDPAECIDCGACEPECPVHAIYEDSSVPAEQKAWIATNAERAPSLPVISEKQDPLPSADAKRKRLGL